MAKNKVLSLSTSKFDRPIVEIEVDGETHEYEMRAPEELSIAMMKEIKSISQAEKDAKTEDDIEALADLQVRGVKTVMVDLPDEVIESLTFGMMGQIVQTFGGLVGNAKPASEQTS